MLDDIRPYARVIHLAFSLLAALVVYCLTWYTLSGWENQQRWRFVASFCFASASAVLTHCILDWVVGVP